MEASGSEDDIDINMLMDLFFQAIDGIRDAQESRGLGDVYKRQAATSPRRNFVANFFIVLLPLSVP